MLTPCAPSRRGGGNKEESMSEYMQTQDGLPILGTEHKKPTHTPTPWTLSTANGQHIYAGKKLVLQLDKCAYQNAALIVRAVNSYAAMREALKEAHRYFRNRPGNHEEQLREMIGAALAVADK